MSLRKSGIYKDAQSLYGSGADRITGESKVLKEIEMLTQHIAVLTSFLEGKLPLDSRKSLAEQESSLLKAEEGLREKRMRVHRTIEDISLVNALLGRDSEETEPPQ